jgi:hypothetical protein
MPAQISHCLAAEEALAGEAPELASSWGLGSKGARAGDAGAAPGPAAAWFRLGAQGPDIFYHNQRTKPSGLHYGALAHRRNYGLIIEGALRSLLASGAAVDSPESAWLLGFATHAALDRAVHPYIVYFAGWQRPTDPESARFRGCHPFLERLLDLVILEEKRGLRIGAMDMEVLLPLDWAKTPEERGEASGTDARVVAFLAEGLREAYPRAVGLDFLVDQRITNALADARFFFRMTNPARTSSGDRRFLGHFDERWGHRAIALIYPEELPRGIDLANRGGGVWEHPSGDGRKSRAGFLELFDEGVEGARRALRLVLEALRSGSIAEGLAAALGNGGLSVAGQDGLPLPPRLSRPLPLAEIMELEFQKRLEQAQDLAAR